MVLLLLFWASITDIFEIEQLNYVIKVLNQERNNKLFCLIFNTRTGQRDWFQNLFRFFAANLPWPVLYIQSENAIESALLKMIPSRMREREKRVVQEI